MLWWDGGGLGVPCTGTPRLETCQPPPSVCWGVFRKGSPPLWVLIPQGDYTARSRVSPAQNPRPPTSRVLPDLTSRNQQTRVQVSHGLVSQTEIRIPASHVKVKACAQSRHPAKAGGMASDSHRGCPWLEGSCFENKLMKKNGLPKQNSHPLTRCTDTAGTS